MNAPRQRISSRDYKHGAARRGGGFDLSRYQQFAWGLGLGLLVALGVFVQGQRQDDSAAVDDEAAAAASSAGAAAAPVADEGEVAEQYDFYDMLPKFEVVVAEQEGDVRRDLPSVPVEKPGAYVLQAGSFSSEAEAARQRQKLATLGIDATVQRVAVDADVRHRVRIGPLRDLPKLNAARRQLRAADIDVLLIRVGD